MDLSFSEIATIVFIAVMLFGPKKIPEIARGLGHGVRTLRNAADEIKREVMKEADGIENPVTEIKKEINSFKEDILKDDQNTQNEGPVKR